MDVQVKDTIGTPARYNIKRMMVILTYLGKRKQETKVKFLVKKVSVIPLTTVEYHDVLPNTPLTLIRN